MILDYFSRANITLGLVILLCFFLPWISVDCGDVTIVKLSGYDLTMGHIVLNQDAAQRLSTELEQSGRDANALQNEHQTRPQFYLLVAVICALGIVGYSFRMLQELNRVGIFAVGAFGVFGTLLITVAALRDFGMDLPADVAHMVRISHSPAFYILMASYLSSVVLSVIAIRGTSESSSETVTIDLPVTSAPMLPEDIDTLPPIGNTEATGTLNAFGEPIAGSAQQAATHVPAESERFCPSCGSRVTVSHTTCGQCGSLISSVT